jgi:predicted ArsR family transcriptional regulator
MKTLAALPNNPRASRKWTLEEDAAILKFAESKGVSAIAKAMGLKDMAVRRRYQTLKQSIKN